MTGRVLSLALAGFLQLGRSRVYLNLLVAGMFLVAAALAFEELTANAGGRVLFDVGLAFIALVVAALAGVVSITGITRDLETRQVHLIIARPVARSEFVFARFLTSAMLVLASNAILGGVLACLLALTGADHAALALGAALFASFEGFIIAAVAMFFGAGSSSTMSAVFTTTLFILGRLSGELYTLIERGTFGDATWTMRAIYSALPHLTAFDLTAWASPSGPAGGTAQVAGQLVQTAAYGCAYTFVFLGSAAWRFERRDLL